ncbi:MAG: glycosyltransferase, partial [Planctomycetota bacterium]
GFAAEFSPNATRAEKLAFLRTLSVLSVPATCGESFGLYLLEGLAAGVPVVEPRHGAFPELLEATGGGILCEPDDPASLAEALESLLLDQERSQELAERGRRAVLERFTSERMAREFADVCQSVVRVQEK